MSELNEIIERARKAQELWLVQNPEQAVQLTLNWQGEEKHASGKSDLPSSQRLYPDCYRLGKRGVRTHKKRS